MLFSPHTYPSMHWGLFIRNKKKESLICVRFRQRAPLTHSLAHIHTHICAPAEQGAVPLLGFHISKSLGCFGTAGVVVLFYKRQTSKELGMRSRTAFDTVLKWGLGSVTCMIYMCIKAVVFFSFFFRHCQMHVLILWRGSPHSPLICFTTKQHHLQNCLMAAFVSEVHGKHYLKVCGALWWMVYTGQDVSATLWHHQNISNYT